ncbi:uncharacterized protein [Bemisia tabaci]|uniref:uncharacterized protein n=1 Tax=Bemisia tabaci TaxID=7038 RepID=UPI003B28BD77
MQNSPEFNAFFVSVVKKHEVLYNHSLIGRSDKDRVREAWQKVAAEVQGTEHECKDRWRCLRVCFLRMLRYSQPNHRGVRQNHRKAYYLADAMNFLLPYVKPKHAPLGFEPLDGPVKTEPDFGVEDGLDSEDQSEDQSELYRPTSSSWRTASTPPPRSPHPGSRSSTPTPVLPPRMRLPGSAPASPPPWRRTERLSKRRYRQRHSRVAAARGRPTRPSGSRSITPRRTALGSPRSTSPLPPLLRWRTRKDSR